MSIKRKLSQLVLVTLIGPEVLPESKACFFEENKSNHRSANTPERGEDEGLAPQLRKKMEEENRQLDALIQKGIAVIKHLGQACMPSPGSKK